LGDEDSFVFQVCLLRPEKGAPGKGTKRIKKGKKKKKKATTKFWTPKRRGRGPEKIGRGEREKGYAGVGPELVVGCL